MCHSRVAGFAGSVLQKIGFPDPGAVGDQDNLIMSAFNICEGEFMSFQSDTESERRHQAELNRSKTQQTRGAGRRG